VGLPYSLYKQWAAQKARIMAAPATPYSPTDAAARAYEAERRARSKVSGALGAKATVRKYAHGNDCRRWMSPAEYERDYAGSAAVVVRDGHGDETRVLVHLCGKKSYEGCRIAAVYNRIPDSRVSRSDTTDMIQRCHMHKSGYVQAALRDTQTRYTMGKPTHEQPQGMTEGRPA
jgi:hypothetical protein